MDNQDIFNTELDVLIVGGGLTGALLYIALAKSNLKCLLIDSKSFNFSKPASDLLQSGDFDARSLALASASVRILKNLDIWPQLEKLAAPIERIHISQQGKFGNTLIPSPADEKLGYVIEMHLLQNVLNQFLAKETVLGEATLINYDATDKIATILMSGQTYTLKTKLIVAADGTNSKLRDFTTLKTTRKNFAEQALVANIGLARPHLNIAYERFTKNGPLAILPMTQQRGALIWSLPKAEAEKMCALAEKDFLQILQTAFGYRLGRFIKVGKRSIFPLQQVIMPKTYTDSMVFIGNAAHTLHPVAGQGFNLGLRDVAALAECLIKYNFEAEMLEKYQLMRNHDQKWIKFFTENLITVFKSDTPILSMLRGLGLLALDNSNIFKDLLERYARGFAGKSSDLVCGIPLEDKQCIM